ncbi:MULTISPECIES: Cdc6/Cdc18 family protein [Halorussus]|uniref:Cdc6/Cdc18 family protein n=1 Tax=Halorussus TaxID=1070314 RepID=UPI00209D097A|nr:Cdc6/Cdc18 family protein [Halorussus vallis]USZ77436.1 orc1/cdc6 family replication initiation protein [Halorussus vallis]
MITDARALRKSYVPQELHHREGQIDYLSSALRPITDGDTGEDAFIFGPTGTGKTTIAKFVLRQLEREALDVRWGYVNCISDASKAAVLHRLVRKAGCGADLRKEGTATSTFLDRLRDLDSQFVAIVDEVHVLDDMDTLLALYELENVSMVMVTLDEKSLFAEFGSQLESRLRSSPKVDLDKYGQDEMVDILQGRVEAGLSPGSITDEAVDYIADLAAGDARQAIALLRRSAKYAIKHGDGPISPAVVSQIRKDAQRDIRSSRIAELSTHQRLLFDILREAGELSAGELHSRYEEQANNPKTRSARRRYLGSLEDYELITSRGAGRGTRYEFRTK